MTGKRLYNCTETDTINVTAKKAIISWKMLNKFSDSCASYKRFCSYMLEYVDNATLFIFKYLYMCTRVPDRLHSCIVCARACMHVPNMTH